MRVAFLIGSDDPSIRLAIEAVCKVSSIEPVGILLDTEYVTFSRRLKNLKRNIRSEGLSYIVYRALQAIDDYLLIQARNIISQEKVKALLKKAFPERIFSLYELGERYNIPIYEVENLNSMESQESLKMCRADLGIVIGTRILKRSTFSIPTHGCINIHKGKVPDYRGLPPGFWELYDGAETAGVTVHYIDDGLDTGDIIRTSEIVIHEKESEFSIREKLDTEGARLLAQCAADISLGTVYRNPQPKSSNKAKTKPTRAQRLHLQKLKPHCLNERDHIKQIIKTIIYLFVFYSGLYHLVRFIKNTLSISRAAILLHHRVNDFSLDKLTTNTETFAEHLVLLEEYYQIRPTSWILDRLQKREALPPLTVAIHFDDCYKDVFTNAAPLLMASGFPAMAFISTGYLDSPRQLEHDKDSPFVFENMSSDNLRQLLHMNFEIGAHTVNHVDLGTVTPEEAAQEVVESRAALERILNRPIDVFSYPFGKESNINDEARRIIHNAGFKSIFSAHGGFVSHRSDLFNVPRIGAYSDHVPLYLMMEIEGLSLNNIVRILTSFMNRINKRGQV